MILIAKLDAVLTILLLFEGCVMQSTQPSTASTEHVWSTLTPSHSPSSYVQSLASVHHTDNKVNSSDTSSNNSQTLILYISISVAASTVFLVVMLTLCFCRAEKRKRKKKFTIASERDEVIPLSDVNINENFSVEIAHQEPSLEIVPLVQRDIWEIPRQRLQLGKKLGEGAFGFVFKGTLTDQESFSKSWTVAVKTVKDNATESDLQDLVSELNIMKRLKPHPNVVSLIGAIRNEVPYLLVIVEFVPYGDLLGYLRKSRGIRDTCYYDPDHLPLTSLTSGDLMKFAIDSARGMEYLSMKKIVHRDLAARNVLVGAGGLCKITDFGMARDVRQKEIYMRTTRGLIPVKWTAIESILRGICTTRSDVWSFGILLFEILTVGGCPYPRMNGYQVRQFISEGRRMSKPVHVDNELYAIMLECWQSSPRKRPTFKQLVYTLKRLEPRHKEYINLSDYDPCHYENIDNIIRDL